MITPGQRLSFLKQDHFQYDQYTVMDTVIMGNQRLFDIMKEKDAIYAKEAEAAGNDFVTGYVKLLIDISNVQTFVRVKQIGKPVEFLGKVFLEGGRIDLATLMELYGESYQQIGEKLDLYGFGEAMGRGGAAAVETGSFALMEKLCDNLKVRYAKGAQFITAGIEPIAAFYVAKEMELKNLRMVLTGKLVGIPEETLKERLREAYV